MKLIVQQNTADARCEWFLRAEDGSETGLLKRADAELIAREFDAIRAQQHPDSARLIWAFGDPENGATRQEIEQLLMHATTLDESRFMIDAARKEKP